KSIALPLSYIGVRIFQAISAPVFCQSLFLLSLYVVTEIPGSVQKIPHPVFCQADLLHFISDGVGTVPGSCFSATIRQSS
ncbi:MAG: hypothetical protein KBA54_01020, partial [Candidatus Cloacimonetes bacterium]|nr:hypothetical protein [Candidatus Cloacimonadota bacterium]